MKRIIHVSKANFAREVLGAQVPVLVDCYADWCGPCRQLAPTLERLALEFGGRVKIVKVDIDTEPELASEFQVSSIPTLLFFAGGKLLGKTAGLVPEEKLRQVLNRLSIDTATSYRAG